ncbi:GNAT family N-acetyltransferase [Occultella aeris]|uniref:Acetyltransferase (GNAT) family protein n=1 Tax=Occultella aeris TaxID=2761496 RepID=A0A7M4DG62_9MICO|nr:GNAT family N-acetyltransferase [Occultella aeris]VZO35905.1 Acetyltransferase (GNAT) family protein [Occultella aeris]
MGSAVGYGARLQFRRAEPYEAKELEELQNRSASHWGYPEGYFDWAGDARRISESYVRDNPVLVIIDREGRKLGFYGFTEDDDGLLLDKMFVAIDHIGEGLGRVLWRHAVQTARDLGASQFIIGADPNAAPFYAAMGAEWYASKPTEEPTWTVQMYRFILPGQQPSAERRASRSRP